MSERTLYTNIPTFEQMEEHNRLLALIAGSGGNEAVLDSIVQASATGENTTRLFWAWYPQALAAQQTQDKYALLCRFFSALARAWSDKTYTLRSYDENTSTSDEMTPLDDLAGKTASPLCTDADPDTWHWMDEDPMYWYIRAQALSLADGTMNVTSIEGEDEFDPTGESAPVYVFKMAKWLRTWGDGTYNYQSWRTTRAAGYRPYAGDVDPTGHKRQVTWLPAYGGGLNSEGKLTSGTGRVAYNRHSAGQGITAARAMTAYEGLWTDCDTEALLHEWQFRHFLLENSGHAEGCTSYSAQFAVSKGETGTKRALITMAQEAYFLIGSSVMIGTHPAGTNNDRNTAANFDICENVRILSKEDVIVDGVEYTALNLDLDEAVDIPGTALVSSAPWHTGETDKLPGHKDGCTINLTSGKTPLRVGGVEVLDGAYVLELDPLYETTAGSETDKWNFKIYECRDSVNQATSITAHYRDTRITYEDMPQGWNYVKAFIKNTIGIVFPKSIGGSSGAYLRSAFYGAASAGVRSPWRFGYLADGGSAGLACENGNPSPGLASWHGRPRLSGAGKKRGEWTA